MWLLGMYPKSYHRHTCTPVFIAVLLAIAKKWKQPWHQSTAIIFFIGYWKLVKRFPGMKVGWEMSSLKRRTIWINALNGRVGTLGVWWEVQETQEMCVRRELGVQLQDCFMAAKHPVGPCWEPGESSGRWVNLSFRVTQGTVQNVWLGAYLSSVLFWFARFLLSALRQSFTTKPQLALQVCKPGWFPTGCNPPAFWCWDCR